MVVSPNADTELACRGCAAVFTLFPSLLYAFRYRTDGGEVGLPEMAWLALAPSSFCTHGHSISSLTLPPVFRIGAFSRQVVDTDAPTSGDVSAPIEGRSMPNAGGHASVPDGSGLSSEPDETASCSGNASFHDFSKSLVVPCRPQYKSSVDVPSEREVPRSVPKVNHV